MSRRTAGTFLGSGPRVLLLVMAAGCLAACSKSAPPAASPAPTTVASRPAGAADPAAEAALQKLAQQVTSAKSVRIEGRVHFVDANLKGSLRAGADGAVSMDFAGTYRGRPVEVFLSSDGRTAKGGPRGREFQQGVPPSFRGDLLAAVAAKGLTPAVTDLFTGSLPQVSSDVAGRIRLSGLSTGQRYVVAGKEAQAINFDVVFDEEVAGHGTLWLAVATGLPVARGLYVRRPREGVFIETYDVFSLGGD